MKTTNQIKQKKNSTASSQVSNQKKTSYTTYLVPLFLLLVMFLFGMLAQKYLGTQAGVTSSTYRNLGGQKNDSPLYNASLYKVKGDCSTYGLLPTTQFLETYMVQREDTLLSIANKQLGDTSRASEIVELNKQIGVYRELSLSEPFIEKGWNLYLPPKGVTQTGGNIQFYAGEISWIEKDDFYVAFPNGGGRVPLSSYTQFIAKSKDEYRIGDCMLYVEDVRHPQNIVLYVFSLDKVTMADIKKQINNVH